MVAGRDTLEQADRLISGVCQAVDESVLVRPGEVVLFDASGTSTIHIARATVGDIGKVIVLKNISMSASTVYAKVDGGGVIDGHQLLDVSGSLACFVIACVHADTWILCSRYAGVVV